MTVTLDTASLQVAIEELEESIYQPCIDLVPSDSYIVPAHLVAKMLESLWTYARKKKLLPRLASLVNGIAAKGESGAIYLAPKVEFAYCLPQTCIHPAQFLISCARKHNEPTFTAIAFNYEPTGTDLDFMRELSLSEKCEVYLGKNEPVAIATLGTRSITPLNLSYDIQIDNLQSDEEFEGAARVAACFSRAIKSNCQFGVVIQLNSGKTYAGSYIETTNGTSLGPLQDALIELLSEKGSYSEISKVHYAERYKTPFSIKSEVEQILHNIAPDAKFIVTRFS